MITDILKTSLQQVLADCGVADSQVFLEHPADESFGDWSSNAALQYVRQTDQFRNPREFADALAGKLQDRLKNNADISGISVAGPGFINFTLSQHYWLNRLRELSSQEPSALISQTGNGKTIIVEYSSPNIAKPFTIGHLRSTIIGDAIANVYEAMGWQVHRDNHIGDWGTQFGKLIYALKTWGDQKAIEQSEKPVKELAQLYVKFHQEADRDPSLEDDARAWFKKLEEGDQEARRIWQWCVEISWQEFDKIYTELGVTFTENNDRGYGESFFEDKMTPVLEILEEKLPREKLEENGGYFGAGENGAQLVFFKDDVLPSLMIVKKDGATLYSTRDLATDYFRLQKFQPDLVVNEVGSEQNLYWRQIFAIEEMLGWYKPGQRVHVRHGLYRFKDKKMSTRKGDVIWLEDVIEEAQTRALQLAQGNQTVAEKVSIGALKWNDLKSEAARDIAFDWDEILSMKGNAGPYVQYAAVRANSVLKKANLKQPLPETYLFENTELSLIRYLDRFEEAVNAAAKEFAPHHLATFVFEIAQRFNAFYNSSPIVTADNAPTAAARIALTQSVRQILTEGLRLLGIETPEEM